MHRILSAHKSEYPMHRILSAHKSEYAMHRILTAQMSEYPMQTIFESPSRLLKKKNVNVTPFRDFGIPFLLVN